MKGTNGARRPRILYLTQIFDPEGAFKGLSFATALRDEGFDVEVITGLPNYPHGKIREGYKVRPYQREMMEGIIVHRVPLYPSRDQSALRRSLTYLSFFTTALIFCLLRGRRYDAIYVYHPPMTVGFAAALSGLVTRTPFLIDIQDLWPESVTASGMSSGRIDRVLRKMCDFVYRRAARIVAQSRGMGDKLAERGADRAKIRVIYNWAEERYVTPRNAHDLAPYALPSRFNFVYGGNFGLHQALGVAIEAAARAQRIEPSIQLVLVGDGLERPALERLSAERGGSAVRIMPAIHQKDIADVFAAADVLLVHLAALDFFEFTVPSKTQFYLASGKPILGGLVGEAAQLIEQAGAGIAVPPENIDTLADAMVRLARTDPAELAAMGARGRQFYVNNLSFRESIARTGAVVREVLAEPPGGSEAAQRQPREPEQVAVVAR